MNPKKTLYLTTALLLISASIFRIFFLDLVEFKADEAYTVYELESFYASPYLMEVGPISSTKVYNPPFYNYLMIVLSFFSREPQVLSFIIGLISTICVPIFYLLVRKYYSNQIALWSALLMALSPISILYSRKIWNTNLLLPFCLAYFYFLHQVILKKDKKSYLGLFLTLILASQIHLSALFLTVALTVCLLIWKKKINFKAALIGILLALIPALPYLYRQFPVCIDCQALFSYQSSNLSFDPENFIRPFQIVNGIYFQDSLGTDYQLFLDQYPYVKVLNVIFVFEFLIPILGIILLIKQKSKFIFIPVIMGLMVLILFITRTPAYIYHTITISPFIYLFYALSLESLGKRFKSNLLPILILIIILVSNFIFQASFIKFISEKKDIKGYYGPIFSLTDEFVKKQIMPYQSLPDYQRIRIFALAFSQFPPFHLRMAEYFSQHGQSELATQELNMMK